MNYKSQLETIEWKNKRKVILERDNYSCQNCFNNEYSNQFKGEIAEFCYESDDKNVYNLIEDPCDCVFTNKEGTQNLQKIFVYFFERNEEKNYVNYFAIRKVNTYDHRVMRYKHKIEELERIKKDYESFCAMHQDKSDAIKYLIASIYGVDNNKMDEYVRNGFLPQMKNPELAKDLEPYEWIEVKNLHIHHNYYQNGLYAWEYPKDALTTLCWFCHEKLHESTEIEVRDKEGNKISMKKVCKKCHGAGMFPEFRHVESGICFSCNGAKYEELI